jgi:hypothetical protein
MIMDKTKLLEFTSHFQVMKPAHIDDENPNHLQRIKDILASNNYAAEEKIDGCHYLCFGGFFVSTENIDKTDNFPHLRDFFQKLGMTNIILDGEVNYPGKTSQFCTRVTGCGYAKEAIAFQNAYAPIHYTMWDILRTPKGTWLFKAPYKQRRALLEEFYNKFILPSDLRHYIHLTDMRLKDKGQYFEELIAAGREGCVLKDLNSFYIMGKKPMWQWMKLKQKDTADLILTGYKDPKVEYNGIKVESWPYWKEISGILQPVTKDYYLGWIGALELSAYIDGQLTFVCYCAGLAEDQKIMIKANPDIYLGKVCKISYMEKTEKGIPRHPRFETFHEGKTPKECTWEFNTVE